MKKLKVILSAFALLLAIGGTFATQTNSSSLVNEYEFIPGGAGVPDDCDQLDVETCGDGAAGCTIGTHPVGDSPTPASGRCGNQLNKM